jgi:ribonuclease III
MESQGPSADSPSGTGLDALQANIGYRFNDTDLLRTALTHSSFVAENEGFESYERLEFLGDAVLELLTTEIIYSLMPDASEGVMTKVRASVVDIGSLADIARQLDLGSAMYLGIGESRSGGADRDSLLSDVVESVLGAIFIDGGIDPAKRFVASHWQERVVVSIDASDVTDSRSLLQEHLARTGRFVAFTYERTGPDHAAVYRATAIVDGDTVGMGTGSSKKTAAIAACADALDRNTSM